MLTAFAVLVVSCAPAGQGPVSSGAGAPVSFDPDSMPEAFRSATAALMWPGASRAFEITPAGDLYNGAWTVRVQAAGDSGAAAAPRVIAYEQRWMPVAHWTRRSGSLRWDFEAAALASPVRGDSGLFVSFLARATNLGGRSCAAQLDLSLAPPDTDAAFFAWDAPAGDTPTLSWASGRAAACGWTDASVSGGSARVAWTLTPGASREQRAILSAYPVPSTALADWARVPHAQRLTEARSYWTRELARGAQFELGDPQVEAALHGALVVLLACREDHGGHSMPIGGPFQYRDTWIRDAARAISGLSVAGFTAESRELSASLLRYQWPSGPFLSQRGQLDGTGQVLWAFEQAWLRPAPADSLRAALDAALLAWRWCEEQRRLSRTSARGFAGLLPPAEPHDNEQVLAQLVGNDAWTIAGYRSLARLLRAAHRNIEADSVEAARSGYVTDFGNALDRVKGSDIPASWQATGRDWGNLAVSYPCQVLPASDPRCLRLAARIWREAGGVGRCAYGDPDSLHGYVGADLGTWALLAGQAGSADSVLATLLKWRTASGGAAELFSQRDHDFGRNLPPHATAAAALVSLVRNALVLDDGDTLQLTLGARSRWWRGTNIRRAPTRWGLLDLHFAQRPTEATWEWTPVPVVTALTLPPGTRLAGAPGGRLTATPGGRVVLAPPGTREARVTIASRRPGQP